MGYCDLFVYCGGIFGELKKCLVVFRSVLCCFWLFMVVGGLVVGLRGYLL